MRLNILCDKVAPATYHMEEDRRRIFDENPEPLLRIYEWSEPGITVGLFSEPEKSLDYDRCKKSGLSIVRRPTGGGILFHQTDIVCSFVVPCTDSINAVCQRLNNALLVALSPFLPPPASHTTKLGDSSSRLCMGRTAPLDLMWGHNKIGGGAQRKRRTNLLHQVSLFLSPPNWNLIESCLQAPEEAQLMKTTSSSLEELIGHPIDRTLIREAIITTFSEGSIL